MRTRAHHRWEHALKTRPVHEVEEEGEALCVFQPVFLLLGGEGMKMDGRPIALYF